MRLCSLFAVLFSSLYLAFAAHAQTSSETHPFSHESELSIVNVDGNSASESYSAKQKTGYQVDANTYTVTGRYLRTKAGGAETARQWDAGGRYERALSALISAYAAYGAESDPYNGFVQHDNTDLGGKYFFIKSDPRNFFAEAGYRYQVSLETDGTPTSPNSLHRDSLARVYAEYGEKADDTFSYKFWVEYLPNFSRPEGYFVNAEPSLTFILSSYLSLRAAYTYRYHNLAINVGEKRVDTAFTTSLVARF